MGLAITHRDACILSSLRVRVILVIRHDEGGGGGGGVSYK